MDMFEFLSAVQPEKGWTAIVGIRDGVVHQTLVNTPLAIEQTVTRMLAQGRDVYFGVAKFKDRKPPNNGRPRGKDNVLALRSFWMDIDVGPGKPHADKAEALRLIRTFSEETGLERPIIVDSGRGLHVYWPLSEDVSREDWEPVALALRNKANEFGLRPDPTCFEVARILRVPGTENRKGDDALPVHIILTHGKVSSYHAFMLLIGTAQVPVSKATSRPKSKGNNSIFPTAAKRGASQSAMTQALATSAKTESFKHIMMRASAGEAMGCAQLVACYRERATLSEPRWWGALSVAQKCVDRDKAIHMLSQGHPFYDPADTEAKATRTAGPQSCATFEANNPGGCKGCKWLGAITSPIELGHERAEDEPDEPEAEAEVELIPTTETKTVADFQKMRLHKDYDLDDDGIIRTKVDDKGKRAIVVPFPLLIKKHLRDPDGIHHMVFWMLKPKEGFTIFTIPAAKVSSGRDLSSALSAAGVFTHGDVQATLLRKYIQVSNARLQQRQKVGQMRTQFGWADNMTKFVVGHHEYSEAGRFPADLSDGLRVLADKMVPRGTFEKWKEVMDLYGEPGMEPNAFAAATGFGAPLLKLTGLDGALINLIHPDSGTGKTTALRMANSIWGHPQELLSVKNDSLVTRMLKLGYHCNLPFCVDEMTNAEPEVISELSYAITQGVGKDRMKAASNELRANTTRWQTMALCSSNRSFYDKLESLKAAPEGERMRILEYEIVPSLLFSTQFAGDMFDKQLVANYGHVGPLYAAWLVKNRAFALQKFNAIRDRIDRELNLHPSERFWSLAVAANLTGISIAIAMRWVDWDYKAIRAWAYGLIEELRAGRKQAPVRGTDNYLGDFINLNLHHLLIINTGVDRRSQKPSKNAPPQMGAMHEAAKLTPKLDLRMRYEPDQQKLYITVDAFKKYCQLRQVDYTHAVKEMEKSGLCTRPKKPKYMTKGMGDGVSALGGQARVLEIDTTHASMVDMDSIDVDVIKAEVPAFAD